MNNQATAVIIADSVSPAGIRLTTFQLRYWRPIHSELMTHRVFSRNAGSSRARPSQAIINQVRQLPWGPIHWGANQKGMQATTELNDLVTIDCVGHTPQQAWHEAAIQAANIAEAFAKAGYHKQVVNRLLEPFTYIDVVVTATDYANWFALRNHPDAQPEIQELARLMLHEYRTNLPTPLQGGQWHLPYIVMPEDWANVEAYLIQSNPIRKPTYHDRLDLLRKVSAARCARVSYKAFDGKTAPLEDDLRLFEQLLVSQPLHASPAEHQATPDMLVPNPYSEGDEVWERPEQHGNFRGWRQYRKMLPNEFVPG